MINETDYTNNPLTKEQEAKIDEMFAEYDTIDMPGCAAGVIQNGKFIYKKSFGMANLDYNIPITADSKFDLASTSKQFTAACITLLHIEGKLSLDDDIHEYITELPDYGKNITIRNLLFHTSGLRDYLDLRTCAGIIFEDYFNIKDSLKIIFRQKALNFDPGEKHSYSNTNYILLAEIVNRVSGKSIRQYAEDSIFKPLGMNNTFFCDNCRQVITNRVCGYDTVDNKHIYFMHNFDAVGDGGIFSTMNDMLKWDNNFYDPRVGGKDFLDLIASRGYLNNKSVQEYGFGQLQYQYKNKLCFSHAGAVPGIRVNYIRLPEFGTSVILLCNYNIDAYGLSNNIADIILPPEDVQLPDISSETKNKTVEIKLSKTELEIFCGDYWSEEDKASRKIYFKDGSLYYMRWAGNETKLCAFDKDVFVMEDRDIKFVFEFRNEHKSFKFLENEQCLSFFESFVPASYTADDLIKFTGKYYSEELDIVYHIKLETDKLVFYLKGSRISELSSIMENCFSIVSWSSSMFKFRCDQKNGVTSFYLNTVRSKNIEFIKQ